MTLLLMLVSVFPGERIAVLPTGMLPEQGVWQVSIAHRFENSVTAPGWGYDLVQFMSRAEVRDALDKSLADNLVVGASFIMSTSGVRAAGVHAAAALLDWFTLYPGLNADVRQFSTERTWADLGIALHHTFADRIAVVAQPRLTAGTDRLFGSLGLGLKTRVLPAWYAGLEAEPVLLGRDTTTTLVPWTITAEREQGWHNFVLTIGSSVHQSAPGFFRTFRNDNAYDEILDVAKGHFRIGFAIQRKL